LLKHKEENKNWNLEDEENDQVESHGAVEMKEAEKF
jgi:hypothetical protein